MNYTVTQHSVTPRLLAAVHAVMPIRDVPARFGELLGQVYAAARASSLRLDGQNVFVYRDREDGTDDVDFGVGVATAFAPFGNISCVETPAGEVLITTHWGDYRLLGRAHSAIIEWSRAQRLRLAGTRWEVYGHWSDDPAAVRTDIYYLLAGH